MHRKGALQLPMTMMLGKELLSGLWVRPECHNYCCHFHIRSCLTSCFTFYSFFTTRCDTASSLFASKCLGERYAWTAALCDLGDPGWGDPWFPHWALLLLSPSCLAPLCGSVFSLPTGLRTGPLPVLLWLSTSRQPCMIITMHLFAAIERV